MANISPVQKLLTLPSSSLTNNCESDQLEESTVPSTPPSVVYPQNSGVEPFPFFELPAEIRNEIYQCYYLLSRFRPAEYHVPDFVVHGDLNGARTQRGGIRWLNIPRFDLLLVNKRITSEVIPAISPLIFCEFKTYTDASPARFPFVNSVIKHKEMLKDVDKLLLDFECTKKSSFQISHFLEQIKYFSRVLGLMKNMKQLEIKVFVFKIEPLEMECLIPFWKLAKQGTEIMVDLSDWDNSYALTKKELAVHKSHYEKSIFRNVRRYGGRMAQVWVEWTLIDDKIDS